MPSKMSLLIALSVVLASPASATPAYTTAGPITNLNARDVGLDIAIPQANNPMACSQAGTFRLLPSATNYNTVASAIFSAQAQSKPLSVYVSACDTDGASIIVAAKI